MHSNLSPPRAATKPPQRRSTRPSKGRGAPSLTSPDSKTKALRLDVARRGTGAYLSRLSEGERQITPTPLRGSGGDKVILISESGLYKLVLRSDKPEARVFQDWVTSEVLPALRKDGVYVVGEEKVKTGEMSEDEFLLRAFDILKKKAERLSLELAEARKEIDFVTVAARFSPQREAA